MQANPTTTTQGMPDISSTPFGAIVIMIAIFLVAVIILLLAAVNIYRTKRMIEDCQIKMKDQNDKYNQELELKNQDFVKAIIESLTAQQEKLIEKVSEKHENRDLLNTFIKLRGALLGTCTDTMKKIDASRIAIYLFHNGTRSTHGIDFFKMSCICEEIKKGSGIREKLIEHSNVQINLFDTMIDKLVTNGRYVIINNEELQYSSHKMFLSTKADTYTQLVAIFDMSNNILGFVCAEMHHEYDRERAMREKQDLDSLIVQIVPVLSYSDYIDTTVDDTQKKHDRYADDI